MQTGFTKEQLERLDKDLLIQLLLSQQQQLKEMDEKLQKILEQLAVRPFHGTNGYPGPDDLLQRER